MIKGLLQFFLMKRFPRLTMVALGVAALISLVRGQRSQKPAR
jgi:hypothetical protein